ncbi:NB-ARC domain-containing protein [Oscillatoria sp. FACHB-1406]|uniref:nSTAND1 domain-containing NTPase n=1 Tax=Oscillatoria sp. FACHB-1406 TaxID=2692846 RepID=UPI001689CEED|nr:NB-ARC domain-containing protein [Oscillatoria sp. FACHB-1406]MBD2580516.1 ATP-binding protein [Oscillatoria sp. FACHB-1406]
MTVEEAIALVEGLLDRGRLTKVQEAVFRQSWKGETYSKIAKETGYDAGYIKDSGAELWQALSKALGEKVSKQNIAGALQRYARKPIVPLESVSGVSRTQPTDGGDASDETRWVEREVLVKKLTEKVQANCRVLILAGLTGIGKSSLAIRLSLEPQILQTGLVVKVIRFDAERSTFEAFAQQFLKQQISSASEFDRSPEQLVNDLVMYLQTQPCLCILDMVEEILEAGDRGELKYKDPCFTKFFDRLLEAELMPSRLILTSQDRPPTIAQGRYKERSHLEELKGLNPAEAIELFRVWEVYSQRQEEIEYLQRIIEVYEGHPLALSVIAGEIRESPYRGNIQAYWYDYGQEIEEIEQQKNAADLRSNTDSMTLTHYSVNLTDLVKYRIERTFTRLSASSPLAYILLCMGATYRCSVERTAWLTLIADAPKESQIIAFQTLQRRFLLETDRTVDRILYRLHSLIRSIALQHLTNPDLPESL